MSRIDSESLFEDVPLEDALSRARAGHLRVLAGFFAAWCLPSHRLLSAICADRRAVELLRQRAVVVRIDGDERPELRERYGIEAYPTLLVLDGEGNELGRSMGNVRSEELVARLTSILSAEGSPAASPTVPERDSLATLRLARRRIEDGDELGALSALMQLFDGTETPDRLRLGFVLQEIRELGGTYPPALDVLRAARNEREVALDAVGATPRLAVEYAALNEVLGEERRSLPRLERLKAHGNDSVTRAFAGRLAPLLLRHGRYEDIYLHAGRNAWYFRREMARAVQGSEAWWARFQVEAGSCYETTLALGHDAEAREIADTALASLPTLQTFATLLDAALAAGKTPAARALLERAHEDLDRPDALRLERRLASA